MDSNSIEKNSLFMNIIENSSLTKRQIEIIYNINNKQKKPLNITSGAFYREKRQCKNKIKENLFFHYYFNINGYFKRRAYSYAYFNCR